MTSAVINPIQNVIGEINLIMSGSGGKSMTLDSSYYHYWCHDPNTDKWTFHQGKPLSDYIRHSDRIIVRNAEGRYSWYKNRHNPTSSDIDEEALKSLLFVFIGAEEIKGPKCVWVDLSKFRPGGSGI